MYKTIRFILILFFSIFILSFTSTNVLSATYQLNVSGNRLTADIKNVPLSAVIADIGAKTGIQFLFLGGAGAAGYNAPFSLKNESLPIRSVLAKLLSDFNYSLISDGDDNVRQVFILGAKSAAGTGAKIRTPFVMAANSGNSDSQISDVNSSVEGMKVTPGEGMQITPGEGMQISPGEGMQIGAGKGMEIGPASTGGMTVTPPGEGGLPEGMVIGPSGDQEMNPASSSSEVVVNDSGDQVKPGSPFRRPGRWGFRKK